MTPAALLQQYQAGIRSFSKQDFYAQNFSGVALAEIDFSGATLAKTDFSNANLQGANLENANLQQSNLADANLQGANLRGANLRRSNLTNANLKDADLTGAALSGATMPDGKLYAASRDRETLPDAPSHQEITDRLAQARPPVPEAEKPILSPLARSYKAEIQALPRPLVTLLFISYLSMGIVLKGLPVGSWLGAGLFIVLVSLLWVIKAEWSVMVPSFTALIVMFATGIGSPLIIFFALIMFAIITGLKWIGLGWRETLRSMMFFTSLMAVFMSLYTHTSILFIISIVTNVMGLMLPDHLDQMRYPTPRIILYMTTIVILGLAIGGLIGHFM